MANPNLLDPFVRKNIIEGIKSNENVQRKAKSLKDYEIYNDNAYPYVQEELAAQLSTQTANSMPIVSDLNIAKAVVNKEANIYTDKPERDYENITESDEEVLENVYADCGFDTAMSKANRYFKLRNQTFVQVVPKYGKLKLRVLHGHNIDVIPDSDDPETAFAYIVSSFDKTAYLKAQQDNVNQTTADADDYKAKSEKYQVWTKKIVFTMDGNGDLTSEDIENPIKELPFVDIAKDKDFEFFVRIGQALTDFTIDFNVAWSDLLYIARLQGYSIGVLSGDPNLKPESITIGPNRMLYLPTNPSNIDSKLDFKFVSPTPNIADTLKSIDSLIATFLTTRGLDSKVIQSSSGNSVSYSSGLERLLAMIDQFKASKDDFDTFAVAEKNVHNIVVKYLALLSGTNFLDPKYNVSAAIVNSEVNIKFASPEMVQTMAEKLDNAKSEIDHAIADAVSVLSVRKGVSADQANEIIAEINSRKIQNMTDILTEQDATTDTEA